MTGKTTEFRVAMRPGKRRVLPDVTDGRLQDLIETAKAQIRSKGEHPFRVIKQQFGFRNTRLGPGQEPLQSQCGCRARESVHGAAPVAVSDVNKGLVCVPTLI